MRLSFYFTVVGLLGISFGAFAGGGVLTWSEPISISPTPGDGTERDNAKPAIATDRSGMWIIVWQSRDTLSSVLQTPIGEDNDILFSRSTDNGVTWSDFEVLNPNAAVDFEGTGGDNRGNDTEPRIAASGDGTWITVWQAGDSDAADGNDFEIFSSMSGNNGSTWSQPIVANVGSNVNPDSPLEMLPLIGMDPTANAVTYYGTLGGDAMVALSTNGGGSWTGHTALDNGGSSPISFKGFANNLAGTFVALMPISPFFGETAVGMSRTFNQGESWSPVDPVLDVDSGEDLPNSLATDGRGNWIVLFQSDVDGDEDINAAISQDDGLTWSSPEAIYADADFGDGLTVNERHAEIATDGRGNWIAVWERRKNIWSSLSSDTGLTWSSPVRINPRDLSQEDVFPEPNIAAGPDGTFIVTWHETADLDIDPNLGQRVRAARAIFVGSLTGTVTRNDNPEDCAAIRITDSGGTVDRTTATDASGSYRFTGLPFGNYTIEVFSPGAQNTMANASVSVGQTASRDIALSSANTSRISGVVLGETTNGGTAPIIGGRVEARVNSSLIETTFTCGTGAYGLALPGVAKGGTTTVEVTFSADGYMSEMQNVAVPNGDSAEADATLGKAIGFPGTLAGLVADNNSQGLSGAQVAVSGTVNLTASTDGSGLYTFDALPGGVYTVRASQAGFNSSEKQVVVPNSGEPAAANFQLFMGAGPTDVNSDGMVNAVDVQLVINGALGLPVAFPTDVDGDATTNAVDVQLVINGALGL